MRVAVVFGQFGAAADPVNLPAFNARLNAAGVETILVQHTDTQRVFDFGRGYTKPFGVIGASLGAGVAPIMAGYLKPLAVEFVGGFQPSDWDPVMHAVCIKSGADVITRAVTVPANVITALCFRNPNFALTGGLGHATYVLDNARTKLQVMEREDAHPGDFGPAADQMFTACMEALSK